jgi:hypothetical protein
MCVCLCHLRFQKQDHRYFICYSVYVFVCVCECACVFVCVYARESIFRQTLFGDNGFINFAFAKLDAMSEDDFRL